MTPQQIAALENMLILNEGLEPTAYTDTRGFRTVGVGFNLDRGPDARADIAALGLNYDRVRAGTQSITEPQARTLLRDDLNDAIGGARRFASNFDQLSFDRQAVLVDMCFNLGEDGLKEFKQLRRAVERGDWTAAAAEMRDSRWYEQVGDRGPRMTEIMRTGNGSAVLGGDWRERASLDLPSGEGEQPTRLASAVSPESQRLINEAESAVRRMAEQKGLPWTPELDNTVLAVATSAQKQGLTGITHFHVTDGQIRFGQLEDGVLRDGSIDARIAAQTPKEQSAALLANGRAGEGVDAGAVAPEAAERTAAPMRA